jgi:hypothetical protein
MWYPLQAAAIVCMDVADQDVWPPYEACVRDQAAP